MVSSTIFCTKCGTINRRDSLFCFACGQLLQSVPESPSASSASGPLLKQRYRVVSRVGNGGFGAVYKAEDTLVGRRLVAVKELQWQSANQQGISNPVMAFKREAMMLASLKHPSLPGIYDHFTEAGRWYLVMDYIEGETLEARVEKMRRLRAEEVLHIALQLSDALNYLHSHQPPIIFRDLKPANIIMTPQGRLYLIDFGLARLLDAMQSGNSNPFGSPGYAAPEQYDNPQTTARSDIYSLGVVLHQALTGANPVVHPFQFVPLRSQPNTTLAEFGAIIMQMLELNPARRPESMAIVQHELNRIATLLTGQRAGMPAPVPGRSSPPLAGAGVVAPPTGSLLRVYEGQKGEITALACAPNGTSLASASNDGSVQVWNASTASTLLTYRAGSKRPRALAWSPDGSRLAIGYSGDKRDLEVVHIILTSSGEKIHALTAATGFWNAQDDKSIYALAWSPDGSRLAWGGGECKVDIWDARTQRQQITYKGHDSIVNALAWSPDGIQVISTGSDDVVHLWNAANGRNNATYFKHAGIIAGIAWSSNGQRIATASHDKTALVWNAITGTTLATYREHTDRIHAIGWSPDGSRIATGGRDGTVRLWDPGKGSPLFVYKGHLGSVNALCWLPDGKHLASAGSSGTTHIWRA